MIKALTAFLAITLQYGPDISPKATLAHDVVGALKGLNSLSFIAQIETKGTSLIGGEAKAIITSLQISMKKGGKFRVEATQSGKSVWAVVSDGNYVTEWSGRDKSWTQYTLQQSSFGEYVRNLVIKRADAGIGTAHFGKCWLDEDSGHAAWLERVIADSNTRIVGTREICGRKCLMIDNKKTEIGPEGPVLQRGSIVFSMCFDRETHFLTRELESSGGGPLGISIVSFQREIGYSKMMPNLELSDELFVFEPPAGSKFISPDDPRFAPPPKLDGKSAPEFSLATLDGQTCKLADHHDKRPVLLIFWATWCGPCNEEVPFLIKLRAEYPEESLAILAVSDEANTDGIKSFAKKKKLNYTVLHDVNKETSKAYQAQAIPRSILIDKTGKMVKLWQGWAGEDEAKEIRAEIAKLVD